MVVKKKFTSLQLRRYRLIVFVLAVAMVVVSGFVMSSINQPPVRVNAKSAVYSSSSPDPNK